VLALVSEDPGRNVAVPLFQRVVDLLDFHLVVTGPRRIAAQRGDSFQTVALDEKRAARGSRFAWKAAARRCAELAVRQ